MADGLSRRGLEWLAMEWRTPHGVQTVPIGARDVSQGTGSAAYTNSSITRPWLRMGMGRPASLGKE